MKPEPEQVVIAHGVTVMDNEALARDIERVGRYAELLGDLIGRSESIHKPTEYRVVNE